MTDVERGSIASKTAQQYGATEGDSGKVPLTEDLPLLLGRWKVQPTQLYNVALAAYVAWFAIHRLADIVYYFQVDARFPPGLNHHYPTEEERLASISYTKEVLLCGFLHRICVFGAVMAMIVLRLYARSEAALRMFVESVPVWWETSRIRACGSAVFSPLAACCCAPWRCCAPCMSWCSSFAHHVWNGRLSTDISSRWGFRLSWRELLFGALYLTLIAAAFFVISAPFQYWSGLIDLKFGFTNPLAVSASALREKTITGLINLLLFTIPVKFVYLAVLQYRRGWFFMFALLTVFIIWAQYNIKVIAPGLLGMNNPFPNDVFAAGRGFPWVHTDTKEAPWISLNRLYYKDPFFGAAETQFSTRDQNAGQLTLTEHKEGTWAISRAGFPRRTLDHAPVYAETISAVANHVLDDLQSKNWAVGVRDGQDAKVGVRDGNHLREKLYGFAQEHKIGIAQIYMVDGSHEDIRANAFVAGAGNSSVIGLFDTLFLGRRSSDLVADDDAEGGSIKQLATGDAAMQRATEIVQNVDNEDEKQNREAPRNFAPTQAMNDDEIISILAHELGHSALKHLEQGMVIQTVTSFITFAVLGWVVQSPLFAAALSLHAPLLHVGAAAYEHIVGPPVEGVMKLFSDAVTRHNEYEADAYATLISEKYGTALQSSLAKLTVNSNQDPDVPYFYELLHFDHPTYARRWAHIEAVRKETYGKNKLP